MTLSYEIEYIDSTGETQYLEVEFEVDPKWENDGIGWYEYWGAKCFDKGHDFVELDGEPSWKRSNYTDEENRIIENMTPKQWEDLCDTFCEKYMEMSEYEH